MGAGLSEAPFDGGCLGETGGEFGACLLGSRAVVGVGSVLLLLIVGERDGEGDEGGVESEEAGGVSEGAVVAMGAAGPQGRRAQTPDGPRDMEFEEEGVLVPNIGNNCSSSIRRACPWLLSDLPTKGRLLSFEGELKPSLAFLCDLLYTSSSVCEDESS